jgi:starch synthase
MKAMRILFAAAEIYPLAKTGGLGDVSAALPQALAALGLDVRLVMPAYPQALEGAIDKSEGPLVEDGIGGRARLIEARMPDSALPVWLIDEPSLFARSGGPYGDESGTDWADNAQRFGLAARIAARIAAGACGWLPDVVHANDWHFGLLPMLLAGPSGKSAASVFTIHNLAFQGLFPKETHGGLGLPPAEFTADGVEFHDQLSFLKAGIRHADRIATVSPAYAREILTPEFGCGLDGLLRSRGSAVSGILNGIDETLWDPETDPVLSSRYSARNMVGKRACKAELQRVLGLDIEPDLPLVVMVSRLTGQKMADVVAEAVPALMKRRVQFASLGRGDHAIETRLMDAARCYPGRAAVRIGYEERLAHTFFAGADILLHPARFEPCGLSQLYALRYGTVPVVRHVGGLADTIVDGNEAALALGTATGFSFRHPCVDDMLASVDRTLRIYREPIAWRRMLRTGMNQNFGWAVPAARYLDIYRELIPTRGGIAAPRSRPIVCTGS